MKSTVGHDFLLIHFQNFCVKIAFTLWCVYVLKVYVLPDQKDDKYWDRRRKNNIAAKRSRDARRIKENQISMRAAFLEKENNALRKELLAVKKDNVNLKAVVKSYERKLGLQWLQKRKVAKCQEEILVKQDFYINMKRVDTSHLRIQSILPLIYPKELVRFLIWLLDMLCSGF